jgi:hypothetical protein
VRHFVHLTFTLIAIHRIGNVTDVMKFYYMLCKRKIILVPANKAHGEVELKLKKLLNSAL